MKSKRGQGRKLLRDICPQRHATVHYYGRAALESTYPRYLVKFSAHKRFSIHGPVCIRAIFTGDRRLQRGRREIAVPRQRCILLARIPGRLHAFAQKCTDDFRSISFPPLSFPVPYFSATASPFVPSSFLSLPFPCFSGLPPLRPHLHSTFASRASPALANGKRGSVRRAREGTGKTRNSRRCGLPPSFCTCFSFARGWSSCSGHQEAKLSAQFSA